MESVQPALLYFNLSASDARNLWFSSNNGSLTLSPSHAFYPFVKREKKKVLLIAARPVKRPYDEDDERRRWPRLSYLPAAVRLLRSGSWGILWPIHRLSRGIRPVPVERTFCLFSRRRNSSKTRRFKGGGVAPTPAPTPAIHFAAFWETERINKWHLMEKRFYARRVEGTRRKRGGGGEDPREAGIRKRKETGAEEGPRLLLNSPMSLPTVDADFFVAPVLPFVSRARKRNTLS